MLKAQSLVIRLHNGSENPEFISSLQKLSFSDNNLVVSFKAGNTDLYPLSEIQKLYFSSQTSVPEPTVAAGNNLYVYPNPADNELNIQNIPIEASIIYIYRMDGKLMLQTSVPGEAENINISNLQSGFYLLVAHNQTVKFVKL